MSNRERKIVVIQSHYELESKKEPPRHRKTHSESLFDDHSIGETNSKVAWRIFGMFRSGESIGLFTGETRILEIKVSWMTSD